MRVENTKIKLTIPIPIEKPDKNGVVYTRDAIENAVNNLRTNIPIIYRDNGNETEGKIIGTTTGTSHIVSWDFENQVCRMTVDGVLFYGDADLIVDEIEDNKVTSFKIKNIGLTR